ncbi:hypothetical protein HHI36_003919 [Cryptolaemus montrouzieri]|uniref:Ribosome biogenesis protein NOP53 n=1 Tax=Cryptolaemus montrouzieri TaxID=559131 RepID=A0ABD2NQ91_9CUCU
MKRNCVKPFRMWIDGKCYNIKKLNKSVASKYRQDVQISKTEERKERLFSTKFHLPSIYYIKLDRFRNPQIDEVELKTNTFITFPKNGKDGLLEISGDSEETVEEAREQIHSFIADIRQHYPAMQFIAIPLLSDEIKKNFTEFKDKILSENHEGVEESIFQSPLKLHLTVAVFTLLDDKEKQVAIEALEKCKNELFQKDEDTSTPMKIKVSGLNCMNTDLTKVNVLYADAHLSDDCNSARSLQQIVNLISEFFYDKGLAREYQDSVKLHMTLMNTKYRAKKEGSPKKHKTPSENVTTLSKKERIRQKLANPRCFQILKPHTKVPDPIVKRNRVRTKEERKNKLVKLKEEERKAKGILKVKEIHSIKGKELYEQMKVNRPKRGEYLKDLWVVQENPKK